MTKWSVTIFVAVSLLVPLAANVRLVQSASTNPPISQPLVREGDFAVDLAQALLGSNVEDESAAENQLAENGIAPRNGWIADYPVTPDILDEVKSSTRRAANSGRLGMTTDEAMRTVDDISAGTGLYVYSANQREWSEKGPPPSQEDPQSQAPYPESEIEGYYSEYGPPVVSYYSPPWEYGYLYGWVPYPFWWGGFWFGGFFVLNDFDRDFHNGHGHHGHHGHDGHHGHHDDNGKRVTNHVSDKTTGKTGRIDPATRHTGKSGVTRASGDKLSRGYANTNARNSARKISERSASKNSAAKAQSSGKTSPDRMARQASSRHGRANTAAAGSRGAKSSYQNKQNSFGNRTGRNGARPYSGSGKTFSNFRGGGGSAHGGSGGGGSHGGSGGGASGGRGR